MNFSNALEAIKQGHRLARAGWNGKGMYLFLVEPWAPAGPTPNYLVEVRGLELNHIKRLRPWIGMKTADHELAPWVASQTDLLADDWVLVD